MGKRFVLLACIFAAFMATGVYGNEIIVEIDGSRLYFSDQNPVLIEGRTLVPVRDVFEALGFDVGWDADTQAVILTRGGDSIWLSIGVHYFTLNGEHLALDVPAQIIGGRTMLPLRHLLESVNMNIGWDGARNAVTINTGAGGVPVVIPMPGGNVFEMPGIYIEETPEMPTGIDTNVTERSTGVNINLNDLFSLNKGEIFMRYGTPEYEDFWHSAGHFARFSEGVIFFFYGAADTEKPAYIALNRNNITINNTAWNLPIDYLNTSFGDTHEAYWAEDELFGGNYVLIILQNKYKFVFTFENDNGIPEAVYVYPI